LQGDWPKLAAALRKHATTHAVTRTRPNPYGTCFEIRGRLDSPDRSNPSALWVSNRRAAILGW
jgi:hypothetical protein